VAKHRIIPLKDYVMDIMNSHMRNLFQNTFKSLTEPPSTRIHCIYQNLDKVYLSDIFLVYKK